MPPLEFTHLLNVSYPTILSDGKLETQSQAIALIVASFDNAQDQCAKHPRAMLSDKDTRLIDIIDRPDKKLFH